MVSILFTILIIKMTPKSSKMTYRKPSTVRRYWLYPQFEYRYHMTPVPMPIPIVPICPFLATKSINNRFLTPNYSLVPSIYMLCCSILDRALHVRLGYRLCVHSSCMVANSDFNQCIRYCLDSENIPCLTYV